MPNIAEPISTVEMFVVSTGRRVNVCMFMSGCGVRRSNRPNSASTTRPPAKRPSVRGEPQPQSAPREIATRSAVRPAARMPAPGRSMRPGVRIGDSGTKSTVVIVARTPMTAPSQKIQW